MPHALRLAYRKVIISYTIEYPTNVLCALHEKRGKIKSHIFVRDPDQSQSVKVEPKVKNFRIYTQKKVIHRGALYFYYNTPRSRHSITACNLKIAFLLVIVPKILGWVIINLN